MNRRELFGALSATIALPLLAKGRRLHRRARAGPVQVLDPHQSETRD
jgi:hypothetical protein